jgi:hypothetical protein
MKRSAVLGCAVVALSTSCGGADQTAPTPTPSATTGLTGRIMGPADDARDTADRLEDRQRQQDDGYP